MLDINGVDGAAWGCLSIRANWGGDGGEDNVEANSKIVIIRYWWQINLKICFAKENPGYEPLLLTWETHKTNTCLMMVLRAATFLRQLNYFTTFLILRNTTFTIATHLSWALSIVLHTYKTNIGSAVWGFEAWRHWFEQFCTIWSVQIQTVGGVYLYQYLCLYLYAYFRIGIYVFVRVWSLGPLNHFAPFPPCESGRAPQSKVADKAHSKTIISQPQKRGIRPVLKICFDDNHCWQKRAF